jgi:hypothetical protein
MCAHTRMCLCVFAHVCVYGCVCVCVHACVWVCECVCVYVGVYVGVCVCVCVKIKFCSYQTANSLSPFQRSNNQCCVAT